MKYEQHSLIKFPRHITLLFVLGLSGCGGEEEMTTSPLPPPITSVATVLDGFATALPNTSTTLDLSPFIRGRGAVLTSINSLQPGCSVSSLADLNANVMIQGKELCRYDFSARIGNGPDARATLNVLASNASEPVLAPLSYAITEDQPDPVFDLKTALGERWPAGNYNLDPSSIIVQGGTVQGTVIASGNSITFTPPATPDWNRIVFLLKNPDAPMKDVLGSVYITISANANGAPIIALPNYDYQANNPTARVDTFDTVQVNLSNLPNLGIQDPDGDEWQLIEVQSYSATVRPISPNDTSNKAFSFSAATVGDHIVSYIVGDHRGGFRMGLIKIGVTPKERVKDWSNIDFTGPGLLFYAPPLFSELKNKIGPQFTIEAVWDAGVNIGAGNTIGAAGSLAATAYCSGKRFPRQSDLDTLRTATGVAATERDKYPKNRPYLISDSSGSAFKVYDLRSGVISAYNPDNSPNAYVMCVSDYGVGYVATPNKPFVGMTNTVISDGSWQSVGTVSSIGGTTADSPTLFGTPTNSGPGSLGNHNFRLNPNGCIGNSCILEVRGASNEYGNATAQISNKIVPTKTTNIPLTFLQNAKVSTMTVTVNNVKANGVDNNVITLTLKDAAGNPIAAGTPVKLDYTVETSANFVPNITPAKGATVNTTGSGIVKMNITSLREGTVIVRNLSVKNGLPSSSTPESVNVTFSNFGVIPNFVKPDLKQRTWYEADAFCKSLNPAGRVPTAAELQKVFLDYTSATVLDGLQPPDFNNELCSRYGWPLSEECGGVGNAGQYWSSDVYNNGIANYHSRVYMYNGNYSAAHNDNKQSVACIIP